jgi:hypothetical protein
MWRVGDISWKLHSFQQDVYKKYRTWQETPIDCDHIDLNVDLDDDKNLLMPHIFVLDWSRRVGKTFLLLCIKIEDCIRQPNTIHTFACAFEKDVKDIIVPLMSSIIDDAPSDVAPVYHGSQGAEGAGFYFPNGSRLRTVGIDRNPRGLAGRYTDGYVVTEAGFINDLFNTIVTVVYPQLQNRSDLARIILESSAPDDEYSDFDVKFVPEAKCRGAYSFATIEDNPMLTLAKKRMWIRAAGVRAKHEYYGERTRNLSNKVIPEFDDKLHVYEKETPKYTDCYVGIDPGISDTCGVLWGHYDFDTQRLYIEDCWAESLATTKKTFKIITDTEKRLWTGVQRWDSVLMQSSDNPYCRVSDTDLRLITDMRMEYGISIIKADKKDSMAAWAALRNAVNTDRLGIHPRCTGLIAQLNAAYWDKARKDLAHHPVFSHFDLVAALKYLWRAVDQDKNPYPPSWTASTKDIFAPVDANKPRFEDRIRLHARQLAARERVARLDQLRADRDKKRSWR